MTEGSFKLGFEGCLGIDQFHRNSGNPGRKNSVTIKGREGCQLTVFGWSPEGVGGGREVQDEGTGKPP